jgi:transposase InsO family protein
MRSDGLLCFRRTSSRVQLCERRELPHTRRIVTTAPNLLWGMDGIEIPDGSPDGVCYLFTVMEHWNSECLGWAIAPSSDTGVPLEALERAIDHALGARPALVARHLHLRLDHWEVFLKPRFLGRLEDWGIEPSFSFPMQPQNNGVAERFNRTLREEVFSGRRFPSVAAAAQAVADFINEYNRHWLMQRLSYRSPTEYRKELDCR